MLLDLELPVRFGRPASIQIGKNVLSDIRTSQRNERTPVIVVTAHGHDRPDLAVEVMKAGATDFVKKPFENLEQSIREAVLGKPSPLVVPAPENNRPPERRKMEGGRLTYYPDRIELEGICICTPDNGVIWRILRLLMARKDNGMPKPFPGKRIANEIGIDRGQNGVCDAISPFRRRVVQLLDAEAIEASEDSVIVTGKAGYHLNGALTVEDLSNQEPKPVDANAVTAADRQEWFVAELRNGRKLRRVDFEKQFGISTPTAKRDIAALGPRVDFIGTGSSGHYVVSG